jgi:hypothetical protein
VMTVVERKLEAVGLSGDIGVYRIESGSNFRGLNFLPVRVTYATFERESSTRNSL